MPSLIATAIGVSAAAGVAGSALQANAATTAGNEQAAAANNASANTMSMFNTTNANLAPYRAVGAPAAAELSSALPSLATPYAPTMAQLQQSPGYQFTLQQGQLASENGMAAAGLGQSGAAAKGLTGYSEGLASTTYNQMAQLYYQGNQQAYNMMSGVAGLGENASAMTGQQGLTATGQAGNFSTAGAAASAAGTVGSANAIAGGLSGVGASATNLAYLNMMQNNGMFGGGTTGSGGSA